MARPRTVRSNAPGCAVREAPDSSKVPERTREDLQYALLSWYRDHRRELPWRGAADPYAVWVSEIMLQQTRVETVRDYFRRWMRRFPTVAELATAPEQDVLSAWQGLGYYSRARSLKKAASVVMDAHQGKLPSAPEELRKLPGIGPYSAGAIASIAYGQRAAAVDGNVIRVLCRVFALRGDPTRTPLKHAINSYADQLVPARSPGDFNQALMELGATRCTPTRPTCDACPLSNLCRGRALGIAGELPELRKKAAPIEEYRVTVVLRRRGRVAVQQCPASAQRWHGLWHFPYLDVAKPPSPAQLARRVLQELNLRVTEPQVRLSFKHSITKYRITLDVYDCQVTGGTARQSTGLRWCTLAELDELPMPAPHRKVARSLR